MLAIKCFKMFLTRICCRHTKYFLKDLKLLHELFPNLNAMWMGTKSHTHLGLQQIQPDLSFFSYVTGW